MVLIKTLLCLLERAVKENFRQESIIDFVKGRATDDIVSHKHDELEEFGAVNVKSHLTKRISTWHTRCHSPYCVSRKTIR